MSDQSVNYWKFATIGILLVGATVAATLLVTGRDSATGPESDVAVSASDSTLVGAEESNQKQAALPVVAEEAPAAAAPVEQKGKPAPKPSRSSASTAPPPPPSPVYSPQAAYPSQPVYSPQPAYPPQSVMDVCNRYASEQVRGKTEEVLTNAALGAAIGAAVGAAGGAIAGGGKGAGKGAAIGGVTGVAGGTLYGLNEAKSHDTQFQAAYASCMRSKGY